MRLETGEVSSIGPRAEERPLGFVPLIGQTAPFDVRVTGLDPAGPEDQVQPVDPLRATTLGDERCARRSPGFEESARRDATG